MDDEETNRQSAGNGVVKFRREGRHMFDLIIKGGTLIDGTGAPRRQADIGIQGGRIVAIGRIGEPATQVIDAGGQTLPTGPDAQAIRTQSPSASRTVQAPSIHYE